VDAAVYTLCEQVIADGYPALARFGPDGDELPDQFLDVGPTCGGSLEVFVEPLAPHPVTHSAQHPVDRLLAAAREGHAVVAATVLDGPCAGQWMVAGGDGGTGSTTTRPRPGGGTAGGRAGPEASNTADT